MGTPTGFEDDTEEGACVGAGGRAGATIMLCGIELARAKNGFGTDGAGELEARECTCAKSGTEPSSEESAEAELEMELEKGRPLVVVVPAGLLVVVVERPRATKGLFEL